jgi:NAD(P)H-dependent flavin oxidoreductase YrpB (nitropropane dioxygenase family)
MTLPGLPVSLPVLAAPMAGGVGTPQLVLAAAEVGSLGFLAAGYKSVADLAAQLATVRPTGTPFGVNVFAPNPVPITVAAYRRYADALRPDTDRYGLTPPPDPVENDDAWADKLDLLLREPVPLVSFTFGVPRPAVIAKLRALGTVVAQTVTAADEARHAVDAGVDVLVVQASAAGAHSGTLTPQHVPPQTPLPDLVRQVREVTRVPVIAAGGLATADDVAAARAAGAAAVMVGTVLLRANESGTSAVHKAALADPARTSTVVTRAFTGRPARALRSSFTDRFDPLAPSGYPALHHLTSGLRKAAAAAGDAERVHLWAGTGYRHAREEPAGGILQRLAAMI